MLLQRTRLVKRRIHPLICIYTGTQYTQNPHALSNCTSKLIIKLYPLYRLPFPFDPFRTTGSRLCRKPILSAAALLRDRCHRCAAACWGPVLNRTQKSFTPWSSRAESSSHASNPKALPSPPPPPEGPWCGEGFSFYFVLLNSVSLWAVSMSLHIFQQQLSPPLIMQRKRKYRCEAS